MTTRELHRTIAITALAAGLALLAMLLITLLNNGMTAQDFELFALPDSYAQAIRAADAPLRAILSFDYLFIVFYTTAFIFLAMAQAKDGNRLLVGVALGAIILTALLDLLENHDILTLLTMAKAGVPISVDALHHRMVFSQLKFHSSYLGFFLFAFVLPKDTWLEKFLRWSLWLLFMPLGILVYTFPNPTFSLSRYLFMLSGLLILAWNYTLRSRVT